VISYMPGTSSPRLTMPDMIPPDRRRAPVLRSFGPPLLALVILMIARRIWAAELLLVLMVLVLPGVLLLRALRVPGKAVAAFPIFVPAASLAVLTVSGLAVDLGGQLIGVSHPIRTVPMLLGLEITCGVLMCVAHGAPATTVIPWHRIGPWARTAWPLLIPVLAAAGALRMNNGHNNAVALLASCACLATLVWALVRADRMSRAMLAVVLYGVSLAVMWAYSMRGALLYGYDITHEYAVLHQTATSGVWRLSHPGDAYGALPSVTVLPAELHFLTGISDLMVLKMVYPAIVAIFPVGVFSFSLGLMQRRWAFVAASFIIIQAAFGQEIPGLARQEISLVFFCAMLCVMYDARLPRWPRWLLTGLFSLGMSTSHYSTVYFAIGMMAFLFALQWVSSWFFDIPKMTSAFVVALAVSVASAVLWYGPITKSSSNLSDFVGTTATQGFDVFPSLSGQSLASEFLSGVNTEPSMSAAKYQSLVNAYYASQRQFVLPFADSGKPAYALQNSADPSPTEGPLLVLTSLSQSVLLLIAQLVAGCVAIFMGLRRKTTPIMRPFFLLGIGALFELGLIKVSGTVATAYNAPRAFIQAFAVLGIPLAWSLQQLGRRIPRLEMRMIAGVALALAVIYVYASGLTGALFGGGTAANLSNGGEDAERYVVPVPDLAAADWVVQHTGSSQLVYADRYGALTLIAQNANTNGLFTDVTPETLDLQSWVYATSVNVLQHRARQDFEDHLVTYVFPASFLNSHFGVVYTNGSSEVFHR
jgi:uncharacterized membrane protein